MIRRSFYARDPRVVDGDTVEFTCDTGFYSTHRVKFRLADIDAPESKQAGGGDARQALAALIAGLGPVFLIHSEGVDKYGRWLVTIPLFQSAGDHETVNQKMIDSGFARAYDGGKR